MARKDDSEDVLIQAPTAELLKKQLGWETVFAQDEGGFGPGSLLGRKDDTEVVLTRDGVPVKFRDAAGRTVDKRLRLMDFDNPGDNRYLAVRELWVRGKLWLRRPGLIGFVNGLPLVFIELKGFDIHIDRWREKASAQAQVREDIIKRLFANLPTDVYSNDEINLKVDLLFMHLYTADAGQGARAYHRQNLGQIAL